MLNTLRRAFLRHELWAIRAAIRLPWLSIFMFGALAVWAFAPAQLIIFGLAVSGGLPFLTTPEIDAAGGAGQGIVRMIVLLLGSILAFLLLVWIMPWFFRWYFCCAGLMLGKGVMAQRKLFELETKLKAIQA